jgi:hypothetical protein
MTGAMDDRNREGDREDRPDVEPADRRAKELREKAMDLLAEASIHVQRLEEIGERLGLTPSLADGIGDHLYSAVVAQLDLAAKVVERSHVAAERLLQLGASRKQRRFFRLELGADERSVRFHFDVHNASIRTATVEARVLFVPSLAELEIGNAHLQGRHQTSVEVTIHRSKQGVPALEAGVHFGEVAVALLHGGGQRVNLPPVRFEVWVRKREGEVGSGKAGQSG